MLALFKPSPKQLYSLCCCRFLQDLFLLYNFSFEFKFKFSCIFNFNFSFVFQGFKSAILVLVCLMFEFVRVLFWTPICFHARHLHIAEIDSLNCYCSLSCYISHTSKTWLVGVNTFCFILRCDLDSGNFLMIICNYLCLLIFKFLESWWPDANQFSCRKAIWILCWLSWDWKSLRCNIQKV